MQLIQKPFPCCILLHFLLAVLQQRHAELQLWPFVLDCLQVMSDVELGDELQELRARASAAEASLKAAETALQLQKDKYLRLNADWENYRKRTVSS